MFGNLSIPTLFLSTGLSFLFLLVVFRPLELAFPAKPGQKFFRPDWLLDLCFMLGQYLFWSGAVFWLLTHFGGWPDWSPPVSARASLGNRGRCKPSKSSF